MKNNRKIAESLRSHGFTPSGNEFWAYKTLPPDLVDRAAIIIEQITIRLEDAEADNANLTKLLSGYHQICSENGIAPATSEIYAAAERAGGGNG